MKKLKMFLFKINSYRSGRSKNVLKQTKNKQNMNCCEQQIRLNKHNQQHNWFLVSVIPQRDVYSFKNMHGDDYIKC